MSSPLESSGIAETLAPYEFTPDAAMNARYLDAEQDYHLRYVTGVRGMPPIVHPGLLFNQSNTTRSPSYRVGPNEAGIHAKEEAQFINPAYLGRRLRVTWHTVDHYEKRGRMYTVTETLIVDEDGREILRRRAHGTRTADTQPIAPRPEQPTTVHEPTVSQRADPLSPIGLLFVGRPKTVTLERMRLFSGWPAKNIHTDEQTAIQCGLKAPIASATQNIGHICELMLDYFGEEWLRTGTLTLTFTRPIYPDTVLITYARITGKDEDGGRTRYYLDIWSQNQYGTKVTFGSGTAYAP